MSAGTYEPSRPDASKFSEDVTTKTMKGWDEQWLDIVNERPEIEKIMSDRMSTGKEKVRV